MVFNASIGDQNKKLNNKISYYQEGTHLMHTTHPTNVYGTFKYHGQRQAAFVRNLTSPPLFLISLYKMRRSKVYHLTKFYYTYLNYLVKKFKM